MKKIGIIAALNEEIALLEGDLKGARQDQRAMRTYRQGSLYGKDAVLVVSPRWGKIAAASTATTLIDRFGVELIVFTGVAGSIAPDLEIGDVVVADALIQHEMDATGLGFKTIFPSIVFGYVASIPGESGTR